MSEEYTSSTSKKQRRSRSQRNRPVLITSADAEQLEVRTPDTGELVTEPAPLVETLTTEPEPVAKVQRPTRLPGFFSRVDKSAQAEEQPSETDVVQARLARATRGKVVNVDEAKAPSSAKESPKNKPAASGKAAATPPRLFQTRHFIGMAIYLLVAEFLLPMETVFARNIGLEDAKHPMFVIPIFSFQMPVFPSFILNIATLILLLYILVKVNLLPNSLTAASSAQQRARLAQSQKKPNTNNTGAASVKQAPPVMRQGVKGEHDELYQSYRASQRREKKR